MRENHSFDDIVFNLSETTCELAAKDSGWVELHEHFSRLAAEVEGPGFKNNSRRKPSQTNKILQILKSGGNLTRLKALHLGVMNLTARLSELRKAGYNIKCTMRRDIEGRSYGRYTLERRKP